MRKVRNLEDLKMPTSHRVHLERLLAYFRNCPKIERVYLFGSCVSGKATPKSDIDLFVLGSDITDEDEWDIVWNCPSWDDIGYIPCDLLSGTYDSYNKMSKVPGMIQHAIELRGVDISELL